MQAVGRQYNLSSILECNICFKNMTDPVMVGCSGQHSYDRGCIMEWFAKKNTCPDCQEVLDTQKPLIGNRLIKLLLDEHRNANNDQDPATEIQKVGSHPPEELKRNNPPIESKNPEPSPLPAEDKEISTSPSKDQACISVASKVDSQREHIPILDNSAGQLDKEDAAMPNDQFFKESFQWHKQQADNGNVDSLFWLGFMCQSGKGVEYSTHDAFRYYKQAAESGHAEAQKKLQVLKECERVYREEIERFISPLSQLVFECSNNDLGGKYQFNDTGNELTDASLLRINLALAQKKGLVAVIAARLQQTMSRHKYSKQVDMIPVAEFLLLYCKSDNFLFLLGPQLVTTIKGKDTAYIRDVVFTEVCRIRRELDKLLKNLSISKALEDLKNESLDKIKPYLNVNPKE